MGRGRGLYTYGLLHDVHERWNSGHVEVGSLQSSSSELRGDVATYWCGGAWYVETLGDRDV